MPFLYVVRIFPSSRIIIVLSFSSNLNFSEEPNLVPRSMPDEPGLDLANNETLSNQNSSININSTRELILAPGNGNSTYTNLTPVSGFDGLSYSTYPNSMMGIVPPDVQIAVSSEHIVETINYGMAIWTKTGNLLSNPSLLKIG